MDADQSKAMENSNPRDLLMMIFLSQLTKT